MISRPVRGHGNRPPSLPDTPPQFGFVFGFVFPTFPRRLEQNWVRFATLPPVPLVLMQPPPVGRAGPARRVVSTVVGQAARLPFAVVVASAACGKRRSNHLQPKPRKPSRLSTLSHRAQHIIQRYPVNLKAIPCHIPGPMEPASPPSISSSPMPNTGTASTPILPNMRNTCRGDIVSQIVSPFTFPHAFGGTRVRFPSIINPNRPCSRAALSARFSSPNCRARTSNGFRADPGHL